MLRRFGSILLSILILQTHLSSTQFVKYPKYSNVLSSSLNPNIKISYKTPDNGTCNTVFAKQQQYSGYITLPPYTLAPIQQNYEINTFFYFVEARDDPDDAPLTIWLNGGPGTSSMFGLFLEAGPCEVIALDNGTYGTQSRMWGWDRSSNMLFIDQPNQVGFSYDVLTNGSVNLLQPGPIIYPPQQALNGQANYTFLNGTFGSSNITSTANTTAIAANAIWHFLQVWMNTFPQYNPGRTAASPQQKTAGVHLFAESYGGIYAPETARYFAEQSDSQAGNPNVIPIRLESVGIINGIIDSLIQDYYSIQYAYQNNYGLTTIDQTTQLNSLLSYTKLCVPAVTQCRLAAAQYDAEDEGDEGTVNSICTKALEICNEASYAYTTSNRDVYDIRLTSPVSVPSSAYLEYLNDPAVQQSLGARINFTQSNSYVQQAFINTGDAVRSNALNDLVFLLNSGIRVGLMYGDADWICNWMGGEAVSLALANLLQQGQAGSATSTLISSSLSPPSVTTSSVSLTGPTAPVVAGTGPPGSYASAFPAAGYANIMVNSSYIGGVVRQFGNLSFARVYDAPHFVPLGQPETAFTIFTRIILGTDVATGNAMNSSTYQSKGSLTSNHTNTLPSNQPFPTCWIRDVLETCQESNYEAIQKGQGVVYGGVWYSNAKAIPSNTGSVQSSSSSTTADVTGVFTALSSTTARPKISSAGLSIVNGPDNGSRFGFVIKLVMMMSVLLFMS